MRNVMHLFECCRRVVVKIASGPADPPKVGVIHHSQVGELACLNFLTLSPAFDSLRSEPRFIELVKRIGLPLL